MSLLSSSGVMRQAIASSSRGYQPLTIRLLSSTALRRDLLSEIDKKLNPREIIEKKRKEFEAKYEDKLQKKVEKEGVSDLDALKNKVMVPSVKQALKAKQSAKQYKEDKAVKAQREEKDDQAIRDKQAAEVEETKRQRRKQAEGDRSGIKPLSSILNLPLLHMTPHDRDAIAKIWTAYHTSHPTLSSSFLSAFIRTENYTAMLETAKQNPFFVLPLPRTATSDSEVGEVLTDSYEMFYIQWLFHPTSGDALPPSAESEPKELPATSSIIFTPLEEFKKSGEWAQPHLVMTHYPEMSHSHDLVLMRGEITPVAATGPQGSDNNPGYLLSQQQAQLLALALQKFYCTGIELPNEGPQGKQDRLKRAEALRGFREKPEEWDWKGLIDMAYGGIV